MVTNAKEVRSAFVSTTTATTRERQQVNGSLGEAEGSIDSAVGAEAAPPFLIGGVTRYYSKQQPYLSLSGTGFDALTVTVPLGSAELLMHASEAVEQGPQLRGFKASEKRICMGGHCWRRFNPHQSSKQWGTEYESWEYKGAPSTDPIRMLLGKPSKPTRIDYAFDFNCPDDFYPRHIEEMILENTQERGIEMHHSGNRETYTLYVGSRKSPRMIRFYRRDLKNELLALEGFSILRCELELKDEHALALWAHMSLNGPESAREAAAAHIAQMIGYAPCETDGKTPPLVREEEETEGVQMVLEFVKQNAVMLQACSVAGVDLSKLSAVKVSANNGNRNQRQRLREKTRALSVHEPARLEALVSAMLSSRRQPT